ncbi:MAG: radical SAM protein [Clostridia bacterium]|nr:radical SAM protein [Clostridia bacterium]
MEDEKKPFNPQNGQNNGNNGGNGGRKRKRRRSHGGGNGGQGGQNNNGAQPSHGQGVIVGRSGGKPQNGQKNQNNQKNQPKPQQKQQNGGGRAATNDKNDRKNDRKNEQKKDENRKDTYVYTLDGNLYINLTNKCSNGCDFCVRNERDSYYGYYLWIRHGDPTAEKVIAALNATKDLTQYKEAVFCGFGEPTYKVAEMVAICDYLHEKGLSTRLNTNGQGNLINKRDIIPDLKGKIDLVNVSLNASCAEKYQKICRSQFGENGFGAMIEFAKECKRQGVNVRFSIVDCIGKEEVDACKALADSVRVPLYVRDYITDS